MATRASVWSTTIDPPDAERHAAAVDLGDLLVEVVLAEQRLLALVELQAVDVAGHDQLQELLRPLVRRRLVDVDGVHLRGEDVADGADDHVAFFVDARRAGSFLIRRAMTFHRRSR